MVWCTYCGQEFSRAEHLDRHVLTHTNIKPHKCTTCHFSFKRRDLLQRHYILVHKDVDELNSEGEEVSHRRAIACVACAKAKTKCDKLAPVCTRCSQKGLHCEGRTTKRSNDAAYRQARRTLNLYKQPVPIAPATSSQQRLVSQQHLRTRSLTPSVGSSSGEDFYPLSCSASDGDQQYLTTSTRPGTGNVTPDVLQRSPLAVGYSTPERFSIPASNGELDSLEPPFVSILYDQANIYPASVAFGYPDSLSASLNALPFDNPYRSDVEPSFIYPFTANQGQFLDSTGFSSQITSFPRMDSDCYPTMIDASQAFASSVVQNGFSSPVAGEAQPVAMTPGTLKTLPRPSRPSAAAKHHTDTVPGETLSTHNATW